MVDIAGKASKIIRLSGFVMILLNLGTASGLLGANYKGHYYLIVFFMLLFTLYFFVRFIYFTVPKPKIR